MTKQIDPAEAVKALETAECECWSIKCESYPTGGGDAEVGWEVISHWQAKPHERVEGRGSTPFKAIIDAMAKNKPGKSLADLEPLPAEEIATLKGHLKGV